MTSPSQKLPERPSRAPSCTDDSRPRSDDRRRPAARPPINGWRRAASPEAVTSRELSPFPPRGWRASTGRGRAAAGREEHRPRSPGRSLRGRSRGCVGLPEQADRMGHTRFRIHEDSWPEWASGRRASRRATPEATSGWSIPNGSAQLLAGRAAGSRSGRTLPALPRQLRGSRGIRREPPSRERSISTRICSRTRSTGIAARPRSSRRHCARSGSRTTRRSSSTGGIPKDTPTRSGPAGGQGRSRPAAPR